ncbi:MAG: hypothetical protein JNJ85_13335 [Candidatus Kapabacteria bacterium]|nr:hypothetical protein [Candidatus Kapabacteria bacterium]
MRFTLDECKQRLQTDIHNAKYLYDTLSNPVEHLLTIFYNAKRVQENPLRLVFVTELIEADNSDTCYMHWFGLEYTTSTDAELYCSRYTNFEHNEMFKQSKPIGKVRSAYGDSSLHFIKVD